MKNKKTKVNKLNVILNSVLVSLEKNIQKLEYSDQFDLDKIYGDKGIEARVPFLDHEVFEFASKIPIEWYSWIHFTPNKIQNSHNLKKYDWQKPHQ